MDTLYKQGSPTEMMITAGNMLFAMILAALEQEMLPTMITSHYALCRIIAQVSSRCLLPNMVVVRSYHIDLHVCGLAYPLNIIVEPQRLSIVANAVDKLVVQICLNFGYYKHDLLVVADACSASWTSSCSCFTLDEIQLGREIQPL